MRIFNTYGPRMALDDGRVVSNFVSQVRFSGGAGVWGLGLRLGLLSLCRWQVLLGRTAASLAASALPSTHLAPVPVHLALPGAEERAADAVWRRQADAVLPVRVRPD